jgi:translation initiation factor 3 subunit E
MTTTATAVSLEQWDLIPQISPYLDRHMIFPLLENVDKLIESKRLSYSSKDVAVARLALLRPTHMVEYAMDVYKSLHGDAAAIPKELLDQKESVLKELEEMKNVCHVFDKLCNDKEERVRTVLLILLRDVCLMIWTIFLF